MTRRVLLNAAPSLEEVRAWADRDVVMNLDGLDPKLIVRYLLAELDHRDRGLRAAVWTALSETARIRNEVAAELIDAGVPELMVEEWFASHV